MIVTVDPRGTVPFLVTMTLAAATAISVVGCGRAHSTDEQGAPLPAHQLLAKLEGSWASEGQVVYTIKQNDDGSGVISTPENDTWRIEIKNARFENDRLLYEEYYYLRSGESHPFSGMRCQCTLQILPDDPDKLRYEFSTKQTPSESDILTRVPVS